MNAKPRRPSGVPPEVFVEHLVQLDRVEKDPGRAWMMAWQAGDPEAFRALVRHYGERMVTFFRRYGADTGTAEDLTQEAFLRICRARDRYEPSARFSTWLYRILHRLAMNEGTRNRWRRSVPFQGGHAEEEPGSAVPELTDGNLPEEVLQRGETREMVREAVLGLPENQRTALVLNRFEGLSYEEVGEVLGLKIPAVKSLLFRARENVRLRLTTLLREEVDDDTR